VSGSRAAAINFSAVLPDSTLTRRRTMNSQFIQRASLQPPGSERQVLFTNLSSQQLQPGELESFWARQSSAMQPMPFHLEDGMDFTYDSLKSALSEDKNPTERPREYKLPSYYGTHMGSKKVEGYRTGSQRAWNVPAAHLDARETDML
jgi:hypothetical protein